ncbi:hypothetical protein HPP92_025082 [Vanilla planifolia]|uniref:Uncharacterized protein n=1 Tax=Vanilla planifolia TaxID=51239 RepID=A0A835PJE9_VANPL|nr:hypothetical protein HPP92_025082 [Vanilla planifolia]
MGLLPPPPMSLSYRDGGGSGGDLRGRSDTSERTYQLSLTLESVLLGQFVCVDLGPQGPPKDAATAGVFSSTLSMAQAERTCYKMKAFWSEWRVIEGGTININTAMSKPGCGLKSLHAFAAVQGLLLEPRVRKDSQISSDA